MPERISNPKPPRGLARLAFRLPIWLYRLGLGGLLGSRFLLLISTGRKTGLERRTVLEVVRNDKEKNIFVVAVGFGEQSDWYRNLRAQPQALVQCGRRRWKMRAEFLTSDQAGEELLDYGRRHPLALRELIRIMGFKAGDSPDEIRGVGRMLPMVAFHPVSRPSDQV